MKPVMAAGKEFIRLGISVFAHTPGTVQQQICTKLLQQCFRQLVEEGEFDFLEGRRVTVEISDVPACWTMTMDDQQELVMESGDRDSESRIKGPLASFLLMMSRTVDPDTLFFQRQLVISGDTELGLCVKNLFDSIDPDELPQPFRFTLQELHRWAERFDTGVVQPGA